MVDSDPRLGAHAVMAAACLLKARNRYVGISVSNYYSAIQLWCKERAYHRLNHLGVSMSHRRTVKKVKAMSKNYNSAILNWKEEVERKCK